jgi:hypothetical protein
MRQAARRKRNRRWQVQLVSIAHSRLRTLLHRPLVRRTTA